MDAFREINGARDATELGQVANNKFLGGGKLGDMPFLGANAEAYENGFFELADALTGDI